MKGILERTGEHSRYVFQLVHMLLDGDSDRPWREDEHHRFEFVITGCDLDAEELRAGFSSCAA